MCAIWNKMGYLRPYRDEHTASRPIREVKHRRGQRVLPWVTRREHCAAAGFFLCCSTLDHTKRLGDSFFLLYSAT